MEYILEKKAYSHSQVFTFLVNEMVSEESVLNYRLAAMAVAQSLVSKKYNYDRAIQSLEYSNIPEDEAKHLFMAAKNILEAKGMINEKGNLTVDTYLESMYGKNIHHAFKTPVVWRSAQMGDLELLPRANKLHQKALAERNMPQVYRSLNQMQKEVFMFNKVITNIPDWKNGLLPHEWGFLNSAEYWLRKDLYFSQSCDFRGRMYYRGAFNPSNSGELGKAMFMFKEKKRLGEDGMKALELHIANLAGVKGSIKKRIKWSQTHAVELFYKVDGQKVKTIQKITGEKKIFQLYVALHEYWRVQKFGIESKSRLIIKQDGSCNGIQHSAAILRNRDVAKSVNLCASHEHWNPQDIYQEYADALKTKLPSNWHKALSRSLAKKPVMVAGYGAGEETILFGKEGISDGLKQAGCPELAHELFYDESIQKIFISELERVIEPIIALINIIRAALENRTYAPVTWLTMDRFPVKVEPKMLHKSCFDVLMLTEYHELAMRNKNPEKINKKKSQEKIASSLAVNLIHSLDATHVRLSANAAHKQSISFMHTHDEYGCHAADYFKLNRIIREQFVVLHDRDVFESLNKRNNLNIQMPKGSYDLNEALKAVYMFS